MTRRCWFLALLILAVAGMGALPPVGAAPLAAQGGEAVTISGRAVNGTQDGKPPANHPIALHTIDRTTGRVATREAATDALGRFRFAAPVLPDGGSYVLVMDFDGMRYNRLLEEGDGLAAVEFMVYETTQDIAVAQVNRQTMIIADVDPARRELRALEVVSVRNSSDRTLLPELTDIANPAEISFLRFSLPPNASELDVRSSLPGGDIIPVGAGFAVTAPVPPGDHQISYTYQFPYQADRVAFNQRLLQGAGVYRVLAPAQLSEIRVEPLQPQPRIDVEGTTYLVWEEQDIPPRRGVTLTLSRLPQPGLLTRSGQFIAAGQTWQKAIPAMLGLGLALVLVYAWFRGPRSRPAAGQLEADAAGPRRRQTLVQAAAILDEQFAQSLVPRAEYLARRAELLAQLRRLSQSGSEERGQEP